MTGEQAQHLGRVAVACKRWRWLNGMLGLSTELAAAGYTGLRCRDAGDANGPGGDSWSTYDRPGDWSAERFDIVPDLRDPATLGGLLALVRDVRGLPFAFTSAVRPDLWVVWRDASHGERCGYGATEAEALVAALEAAP